jgi:hypothetical protein
MSNTNTVFVVSTPSAVHLGRCLLGSGSTREAALRDAFGIPNPRPNRRNPWVVEEITEEEFEEQWR